jgi:hypothetical protein
MNLGGLDTADVPWNDVLLIIVAGSEYRRLKDNDYKASTFFLMQIKARKGKWRLSTKNTPNGT